MRQTIYHVNAFTGRPFAGNPAGVCLLPEPAAESWMQTVAAELNLSETAFLVRRPDGEFHLRWFSPAAEVELCGHGTLSGAHVLWETGVLQPADTARFHTLSGLLTASKRGGWIELDFPATPAKAAEPPAELAEALGAVPSYVGMNVFDYLVEVESEAIVRSLRPDFTALSRLPVRGVMVTARSAAPEFDFVSRFFAPALGVNEDPVTGSAHCCLGPYWASRLGKTEMIAHQVSARGGEVRVRLAGERVLLGGQAVTVLVGELLDG